MPPTKQRKHFVLASDFEAARPTVDALLATGLDYDDVRFLMYSTHLRGRKPEDVAFVFTPSFKDHPSYADCAVRVHGMIALGAIVKPMPLTAEDLTILPDALKIDGFGQFWEGIFKDVVTDGVGDPQRSSLRQAAEKAVDAIDEPRFCSCYFCNVPDLVEESSTGYARGAVTWTGAESAAEEPVDDPVEYMQVFLGGFYHGTKSPKISIVPGTEFFFTETADFYETYRLAEHEVLGKPMYFWIHVTEWDDRQRVIREYLLEPLES